MSEYSAPLHDIMFVLNELVGLGEIAQLEPYKHTDPLFVEGMLEEASKLIEGVLAPTNRDGDVIGLVCEDGVVQTPESFKKAWRALVDGGWIGLPFPTAYGGGDMPWTAETAFEEMMAAANAGLSMLPGLIVSAVEVLLNHGSEQQQTLFMEKLITGRWGSTMCLTEPQAGTDLGLVRSRAERQDDDTYLINGQKVFITFGEHDLTENIVHLVLAKTPDAPPGTKGISLFIVPKYLVNDDGTLGDRNDVYCIGIEKKMGIHGSPTCTMDFGGDSEGAIGYLIGEECQGMRQMFTMMNNARIAIGVTGLGIAQRAFEHALAYANERVQGRSIAGGSHESVPIINHADVRRMLMTMHCQLQAMRALLYSNAAAIDIAKHHPDPNLQEQSQQRAALLTPVSKAWCTDTGLELASTAMQVFGGAGYIEETGMAQYLRDMRIQTIYEGTNGVQALDLIGRKLPMAGGKAVLDLIAEMKALDSELADAEVSDYKIPEPGGEDTDFADALSRRTDQPTAAKGFASIRSNLSSAVGAFEKATFWIFEHGLSDPNDAASGATPYLKMFGGTFGGYLLAKSALIAAKKLATGEQGNSHAEFLRSKILSARFYAEQMLPQAVGLLGPVTAGKGVLFAMTPEGLAL